MNRKPLTFSLPITVALDTADNTNKGSTTTAVNTAIANAGGFIKQVLVKAPFDSATFDFRIENASGFNVFKRTQQVGEILDECEVPLSAGRFICRIEKASHIGSYLCELVFAEVY